MLAIAKPTCRACGAPLEATRSTKAFCNVKCRVWAYRNPDEPPPWSAAFAKLPKKVRKARTARYKSSGHSLSKAHVANNSGNEEWYTPVTITLAAWQVMGGVDLDPASNATANRLVGATTYYTKEDDGLSTPWIADRLWLNPPYGPVIQRFVNKLLDELRQGHVRQAILLTNNASETVWHQRAAATAAAMCSPSGRIKFVGTGSKKKAGLQGQTFFYFGPNVERFREVFGQFGQVR